MTDENWLGMIQGIKTKPSNQAQTLLLITLILDILPPLAMFQIPLHGFSDPGIEGLPGTPTEFTFKFPGINGIAEIMAGPVGDKGDQFLVTIEAGGGLQFVQDGTDSTDDIDILHLIMTADIIGFAAFTMFDDDIDSFAVVGYKEPIPHIEALAIYREVFMSQAVQDHEGDELFGELEGAIVI
jgi:hypothetical protein